MINYTEIIAKYINGELSETDKATFEKELNTNADLKKEYNLQLKIIEGVKRLGLKNQISSSFKTVKTKHTIAKTLVALAITVAVVGAVILVKKAIDKNASQVLHELNEQGNTNWSEADKKLETQIFTLNPLRDTIIETNSGIVFSIPANAFLNKRGQAPEGTIDIEIKEAMTASDIIKAGLSNTSNGKLLETGGMFYLNARNGEENLTIDKSKPINANVPVNNNKKDMMLFKGERKADGSINWINPQPLKKQLTTVDITTLHFYPEHFLDSLKEIGYDIKNKKLTDSIYYSFGGDCHFSVPTSTPDFESETERADSFDVAISDSISFNTKGEHLFKQNCAMCHTMTSQILTGPGLEGILDRVPKGDWLKRYILNNEKVKKSGDPYAIGLSKKWSAMPVFEGVLNDADMQLLLTYITGQSYMNIDNTSGKGECPEINPSRIKAIWDKKFNKTILATKEFEDRLKVIFTTCEPRILNLYINNLDKNLYEIDSTATTLVGGDVKNKFLEFYNRRSGGVEISNTRNKKLQDYFEKKRAVYTNAVTKTLQKMYQSESDKNKSAAAEKFKHIDDEIMRSTSTFTQELEMNMNEAYRQLGKDRQKISVQPVGDYYTAPIITTGWYNVDKYVIESTVKRTTLDYTDPETGKKAVIKYEPITVNVNQYNGYDKVVSYMIPDKLSSFQLMKSTPTGSQEKLNELMNYSIITIGYKGADTYYHEIKNAKAKPYHVDLISITPKELDRKINNSFPLNQQTDIMKDINYQLFDIKETARQKQIQKREQIRDRLFPIIFPCAAQPVAQKDSSSYEDSIAK